MMSMSLGICKRCKSVSFEYSEGLEFYSSFCPFCGEGYSREVNVDDDYYFSMRNREIPKAKDSYEVSESLTKRLGVAFLSVSNKELVDLKCLKEDDFVDFHIISNVFGKGLLLFPQNNFDDWQKNIIKEIIKNPNIDKDKSYVTKWDEDKNELILLYGDELIFTIGSNSLVQEILEPVNIIISNIEFASRYKDDEIMEIINEKIKELEKIFETQVAKEVVEICNIIRSTKDDESNKNYSEVIYSDVEDEEVDFPF